MARDMMGGNGISDECGCALFLLAPGQREAYADMPAGWPGGRQVAGTWPD